MMKSIKSILHDIISRDTFKSLLYSSDTETVFVYAGSFLIAFILDAINGARAIENSTKVATACRLLKEKYPAHIGLYFTITMKDGKMLDLYIPEPELNDKDIKNLLCWAGCKVRRSQLEDVFELDYPDGTIYHYDPSSVELHNEYTALRYFLKVVFYPSSR